MNRALYDGPLCRPTGRRREEMSLLKAPSKQIRNATIQVRVEEEIDFKLRKYAEFIACSPAYIVAESLKMLFNKDAEFRKWLAQNENKPVVTTDKAIAPRSGSTTSNSRTMFDEVPRENGR
jgi:predicted transcriptional regulator